MKQHISSCILVLFLLVTGHSLIAGDTISEQKAYVQSIHLYDQPGIVLPTHAFVRGDNPTHKPISYFHSVTAQYGIRTDGRKLWQQLYGYPVWGFGLYYAWFPEDVRLGAPFAIYTYLNGPFKRWKKWSLNYEVDFGISFNWKSHKPLENGYNYPIGSHATVFFDFGINSQIQLGKRTDLYFGLHFTHFSNGSVKLPNYGINMASPRIGIQYIFEERPQFIHSKPPAYIKDWEWFITLSPSYKQISYKYTDNNNDTTAMAFNYGIFTVSSGVNRQISHKVKFGGGIDLSYNEAYGADTLMNNGEPEKVPANFSNKFLVGMFPSFELVINHLSLLLQPGVYIYKPETNVSDTPTTYQRVGLRYYFANNLIAGINIRAYNFSKADFIEFNIGYSLQWKKSYR